MPKKTTVGEARKLSGPGTQVYIRPTPDSQINYGDPDNDVAVIIHRSDEDDVHHALLALAREQEQERLRSMMA